MYQSGAKRWLQNNGVDEGASRVFLSLDRDTQDAIRSMGTVRHCSNPSATLMKRIRDRVGYVPDVSEGFGWEPEWRVQRSYITHPNPPKEIVLFFRGEATRLGGCKRHDTVTETDTFAQSLHSFAKYLAEPLELDGFKVLVFADLMGNAACLDDVEAKLRLSFGTMHLEARVSQHLRGKDQLQSVISSWDTLCHMLRLRRKVNTIEGVYFVRVDVELLQSGLSYWPREKLCFLWRTKWAHYSQSVNDILFYVPRDLFESFRKALETPPTDCDANGENLHWLSEHSNLRDHVWLEYNFNHPSNTEMEQNPRYVMTSRPLSHRSNPGKFLQYELEQQVDSVHKLTAESLSPQMRLREWCTRVKIILDEQHAEDKHLFVSHFATLWTDHWPNDAIAWYKPLPKLLQSMEQCGEVVRLNGTILTWMKPPPGQISRSSTCDRCGFDDQRRPFWKCGMCGNSVCVMCGYNSCDREQFQCERCWQMPPWRKRGRSSSPLPKRAPKRLRPSSPLPKRAPRPLRPT